MLQGERKCVLFTTSHENPVKLHKIAISDVHNFTLLDEFVKPLIALHLPSCRNRT